MLKTLLPILLLGIAGCAQSWKDDVEHAEVSRCETMEHYGYKAVVSPTTGLLVECVDAELENRNYEKVRKCAESGGEVSGNPATETIVCTPKGE
ncbi:MAG: hypothetical protein V7696_19710 [Halioglobus sp.]